MQIGNKNACWRASFQSMLCAIGVRNFWHCEIAASEYKEAELWSKVNNNLYIPMWPSNIYLSTLSKVLYSDCNFQWINKDCTLPSRLQCSTWLPETLLRQRSHYNVTQKFSSYTTVYYFWENSFHLFFICRKLILAHILSASRHQATSRSTHYYSRLIFCSTSIFLVVKRN